MKCLDVSACESTERRAVSTVDIVVDNQVDTYAKRVLSCCQHIKMQIAHLRTAYHHYRQSHRPLSQC